MAQNNITKPMEDKQDGQPHVKYGLTCICCGQATLKQFYQPAMVAHKQGKFYYDCENEECPMQSSLVWCEYVAQALDKKKQSAKPAKIITLFILFMLYTGIVGITIAVFFAPSINVVIVNKLRMWLDSVLPPAQYNFTRIIVTLVMLNMFAGFCSALGKYNKKGIK